MPEVNVQRSYLNHVQVEYRVEYEYFRSFRKYYYFDIKIIQSSSYQKWISF